MDATVLDTLFKTIASRKGADPSQSYTAKLFSKGRGKIAQKVGEEGVECVIAALSEGNEELVGESADLFYHLMVLWAEMGVKPEDVWAELAKREGISGIVEKASRPKE
ncbi:Phosphoribosyl-ATP pyrophosphatase [Candidatus Terasakiella magnetica]|uniref:Phosphoribosyl-ATP pyrophosphatase n=1 Tax=Candidatus Terasakiella magnetica TaxID=1867952 RepID=A0A1C3RG49_9PROT|nr:Phosphoribosyl-ATP pyrophosphatase [Candidatus Terasakiella magnetica]